MLPILLILLLVKHLPGLGQGSPKLQQWKPYTRNILDGRLDGIQFNCSVPYYAEVALVGLSWISPVTTRWLLVAAILARGPSRQDVQSVVQMNRVGRIMAPDFT